MLQLLVRHQRPTLISMGETLAQQSGVTPLCCDGHSGDEKGLEHSREREREGGGDSDAERVQRTQEAVMLHE